MIPPDKVTAIVVTRGDVPLPCLETLNELDEVIVWDNSKEHRNLRVFGRYEAINDAAHEVILVQDDDFVLPRESIDALVAAYQPGKIVANMPKRFRGRYPDSCLVGMGAIFDSHLPRLAFNTFIRHSKTDLAEQTFFRTCDVIFTTLTPYRLVDLPVDDTEWTYAANRMYREKTHTPERTHVLRLARAVRDR